MAGTDHPRMKYNWANRGAKSPSARFENERACAGNVTRFRLINLRNTAFPTSDRVIQCLGCKRWAKKNCTLDETNTVDRHPAAVGVRQIRTIAASIIQICAPGARWPWRGSISGA